MIIPRRNKLSSRDSSYSGNRAAALASLQNESYIPLQPLFQELIEALIGMVDQLIPRRVAYSGSRGTRNAPSKSSRLGDKRPTR